MNHPQPHDWIAYITGETPPPERASLETHLRECPSCADQVNGWRRAWQALDRWKLPDSPRTAVSPVGAWWKWGVAAALVLSLGFAAGRISGPSPKQLSQWQAGISASLRSQLGAEVRSETSRRLNRMLPARLESLRADLAREDRQVLANGLAKVSDDAAATASQTALRQVADYLQTIERNQEQRAQRLLTLIQDLQQQQNVQYLSLRKDLETVASVADDRIRRAQADLISLAAAGGNHRSASLHSP